MGKLQHNKDNLFRETWWTGPKEHSRLTSGFHTHTCIQHAPSSLHSIHLFLFSVSSFSSFFSASPPLSFPPYLSYSLLFFLLKFLTLYISYIIKFLLPFCNLPLFIQWGRGEQAHPGAHVEGLLSGLHLSFQHVKETLRSDSSCQALWQVLLPAESSF